MKITIPHLLKKENEDLHKKLNRAVILCDKTGRTARKVSQLLQLHPHFIHNETYALPPLSLLPALAEGNLFSEMSHYIVLSDRLKKHLPEMLAENQVLEATLEELIKTATEEQHPEVIVFAQQLMQQTRMEDDILYPTAILIGEYLKLKLQQETKGAEQHHKLAKSDA